MTTASEHRVLGTVTGPGLLDKIHRTLDHCWAQHPSVPASIRIAVATGVAEIGANIVQYAGGGRPIPIRMDIEVLQHQVKVVFTDEGQPATVDLEALRAPDPLAKRGRGLALASAVLDELSYHRKGHRNQWTLVSRSFG
jgi:serine/threonine-protein kinase RsbW